MWLESVLGSRARVRVLRAMTEDPRRTWTERELASAIGMSPNTVNLAVAQLRDAGVLDFHRIGRTHAVRLRADLAVVRHLQRVFALERGAQTVLLDTIRAAVPPGVACVLHGSSARGRTTGHRDVDVVVVVADDEITAEAAATAIRDAAYAVMPTGLEIVSLGRRELRRRKESAYVRAILREGVSLSRTTLEAFL